MCSAKTINAHLLSLFPSFLRGKEVGSLLYHHALCVMCGATFQQLNHLADFCETCYEHSTIGGHSMAIIFLLPTTNDNNVMNMQTCNSGASKQHILFTHFLSYSLEQSLPSPSTLWNPKVHYCIYKSPLPLPVLSQINPVHALLSHSLNIHLHIILPSMPLSFKWFLSLRFSTKTLYTPLLSSSPYVLHAPPVSFFLI